MPRSTSEDGEIEVDPEPYSDNFDRPARLLPVEAKALVAAIDLIGEHIPEGSLTSARKKIVAALGEDPMEQGLQVAPTSGDDSDVARMVSKAIVQRRMIELEYYKENEDELSHRRVEPYALTNGREGWYVASFDPDRDGVRHFRLDRIKARHRHRREVRAAPGGRPGGRGRRLAAHGRGAGLAHARACGSRPSAPAGRRRHGGSWRSGATARSSSS